MTLAELKQQIWDKAGKSMVVVQAAADKACVTLPITRVEQAEAVWKAMQARKRKPRPELSTEHIKRFLYAHQEWFKSEYPNAYKDGHYCRPVIPNTAEANGLTSWICQYIIWTGGRATRISSAGRKLKNGKHIPGTTRNGSSDVSSTINGKSVMFEVKVGSDKPSPAQLKEQDRERKAGGEYFFTHDVAEFFKQYDSVPKVLSIFEPSEVKP